MAHRTINVRGKRNVFEAALAKIVIERISDARQTPWPAKDSNALPQAGGIFARGSGVCKVEVRIIRNDQIELPIPIVIHEGAAASPSLSVTSNSRCVCHFFERDVAVWVWSGFKSRSGVEVCAIVF